MPKHEFVSVFLRLTPCAAPPPPANATNHYQYEQSDVLRSHGSISLLSASCRGTCATQMRTLQLPSLRYLFYTIQPNIAHTPSRFNQIGARHAQTWLSWLCQVQTLPWKLVLLQPSYVRRTLVSHRQGQPPTWLNICDETGS